MAFDEKEAINADDKYRQAVRLGGESNDIAATKQFAVSATGNLFVATTLNRGDAGQTDISEEAKKAFGQVSVFFAAMTEAMIKEGEDYRLYDYEVINKMVSGSGLFVKVTDSKVVFQSKKLGISFGEELITSLLGLSGGLSAIASSLSDMIVGIGKRAKTITVSTDSEETEKQVGTIIFVCEYLLGAVSITPIVLSINAFDASKAMEAGPCLGYEQQKRKIRIVKQVYQFVAPELIKESAALMEAMKDEKFDALVQELRSLIEPPPPPQPTQ